MNATRRAVLNTIRQYRCMVCVDLIGLLCCHQPFLNHLSRSDFQRLPYNEIHLDILVCELIHFAALVDLVRIVSGKS